MSDEITTLKTCLLQMQNANVDLVKQLDDCRRECAELKARLIGWENPNPAPFKLNEAMEAQIRLNQTLNPKPQGEE